MTTESVYRPAKRLKIAFIGALPPPYMGPTLATEVILNSNLKEKYNLIHVDTSDHRNLTTLGAFDIGNIFGAILSYWRLVVCICIHRPSVVYIPVSQTTIGYLKDSVYILISRVFLRRVICHLRGGNFRIWLEGATIFTRLYVGTVHRLVHRKIVLGECLKHLFEGLVPEDRIDVIPNGKDINISTFMQDRNYDETIRILFLANMMRAKGVIDLLHSVPIVYAENPNFEFCFAGDWNHPDLKKEVDVYMRENPDLPVRFLGKVNAIEKYKALSSSDIFAFPTYYPPEGHPWVLIEAMAFGLPIVTTDQGAIRETVIDGVNGYLVEKRNPKDLAEKIKLLADNRELRKRMSQESRKRYLNEFTEVRMVERMSSTFDKVVYS